MKIKSLAQKYKYFLSIINLLSKMGDWAAVYQIAAWLAKKYSPYRFQTALIAQNIREAINPPSIDLNKYSIDYLKQQGVFCLNAFFFKKISLRWVKKHLFIKNNLALENLLNNPQGTLFLSYHHHYQHLMVSILGLYGKNPSFVAMSPESSPFYEELKFYIDDLHRNTECHFGKGKYIFIDPHVSKKNVREKIYQTFNENGLVFSLHDNPVQPHRKTQSLAFLNKKMTISVGTIEIALEMKKNIFCGLLEWKGGNTFELDIMQLKTDQNIKEILGDYFNFLESKIKQNPAIWEGWLWFQNCEEL
jgi:lauroyl/myristoyl acyltransferase